MDESKEIPYIEIRPFRQVPRLKVSYNFNTMDTDLPVDMELTLENVQPYYDNMLSILKGLKDRESQQTEERPDTDSVFRPSYGQKNQQRKWRRP